jgi:hypothetical protein
MGRSMRSGLRFATIFLAVGVLAGSPARAGLIHDYEFNGTLADSLGGPPLVSLGGTVGPTSYTFGAQQGLSLTNALTTGLYTIDLSFEFDTLSGYRKILDFRNLSSDLGFYNLNTDLNFYNFAFGPNGALTAGTYARVDLTRDAANLVTGYVNGVAQFSFTDSGGDGAFSPINNIINFFQDDGVAGGGESSSGSVDQIRIYDAALSAANVLALGGPKLPGAVPEPSGVILVATGLALAGLGGRRIGRGSKVSTTA